MIDSNDKLFTYHQDPKVNGYVVKAHFTKPLYYPEYRYIKTAYQLSYLYDAYYSWGKLIAGMASKKDYKLREGSAEWEVLKGYIPSNRKWLDYIRDKFYIRYEDYYLDFENTLSRIETFIGEGEIKHFNPPRKNLQRMYWGQEYNRFLDQEVLVYLRHHFQSSLAYFWPER